MISKDEALHLVERTSKYQHALIASTIMGKLAQRLGEDEGGWELVGLLHDLDYDLVQEDMAKHGVVASEMLTNKLPSESLYAIKSHDYRTGFQPKSRLDNALIIADTLERIIDRITTRGELSVQRLEEEIERISAERPWYKANLRRAKELGLEVDEVLRLGIESVR
jgi:putative nucleotidyltransferase with HDIG domain